MSLPDLNEQNSPPGTPLTPHGVTYTAGEIAAFLRQTDESLDAYREHGRLYVPPGMLLIQPMRIVHNTFHYETGVHTSSRMVLHAPLFAGETVAISGSIGDLYERNGDKYVALLVTVTRGNEVVAEIEHHSIYALRSRTVPC